MTAIRDASPGDAAAIAHIYTETWRDTYAGMIPDRVLLSMSDRRHAMMWSRSLGSSRTSEQVVVAEDETPGTVNDGIVGFGSCGAVKQLDLGANGEIYTLYVLPDFQGRGLGKRLLAALFQSLVDKGLTSALIWVLAPNPARFFYRAMGGAQIAVRVESFHGADLDEMAFLWSDLTAAIAPSGPCSA